MLSWQLGGTRAIPHHILQETTAKVSWNWTLKSDQQTVSRHRERNFASEPWGYQRNRCLGKARVWVSDASYVPDTKRSQHIQFYLKEHQKVWPAFMSRPVVGHPVMGVPPETLTCKGIHGYERHWRTSKESKLEPASKPEGFHSCAHIHWVCSTSSSCLYLILTEIK